MHIWLSRMALVGALLAGMLLFPANCYAGSDTVVMQVGRDTKTMHPHLRATRFITEPPTEDEEWAYLIVMNAVFHQYKGGKIKIDLPILRDVMNVGGAYGVIYRGQRYMLVSTAYRYNLVIIGHELGHHVCGHFEKSTTGWEVELEADRFAGAFARAVNLHSHGDDGWFDEMRNAAEEKTIFENARSVYGPMVASDTHPPPKERILAFEAGYYQGSDCLGRKVLEVRPAQSAR